MTLVRLTDLIRFVSCDSLIKAPTGGFQKSNPSVSICISNPVRASKDLWRGGRGVWRLMTEDWRTIIPIIPSPLPAPRIIATTRHEMSPPTSPPPGDRPGHHLVENSNSASFCSSSESVSLSPHSVISFGKHWSTLTKPVVMTHTVIQYRFWIFLKHFYSLLEDFLFFREKKEE